MATKTVVNISPKVLTGGLFGLGVAVVEAVAAAVNPHSLAFLGPWEPLALAAVPALLGQVAAWFKKEQAAEALPVITGAVAPTVAAVPVEPLVPQTAEQLIAGTPADAAPVV